MFRSGGCRDQIQNCYNTNTISVCSAAQSFCNNNILSPLVGNWDVYYVLADDNDPYPPDFSTFLNNATVRSLIGAEVTWTESSNTVYSNFARTGDWMTNSRPHLETVINAGVRTIIYDGDAVCVLFSLSYNHSTELLYLKDYILNFNGVEAMVDNLQTKFTSTYRQQQFTNWTVAGQLTGIYKNAGTFSYVRIFGA